MTLSPNEASPAKGVDIKSFHHKKKKIFLIGMFQPIKKLKTLCDTHTHTPYNHQCCPLWVNYR